MVVGGPVGGVAVAVLSGYLVNVYSAVTSPCRGVPRNYIVYSRGTIQRNISNQSCFGGNSVRTLYRLCRRCCSCYHRCTVVWYPRLKFVFSLLPTACLVYKPNGHFRPSRFQALRLDLASATLFRSCSVARMSFVCACEQARLGFSRLREAISCPLFGGSRPSPADDIDCIIPR